MQHSTIFLTFEFMYFLRYIPSVMLTWINRAPRSPVTIPKIIAAGKSNKVFTFYESTEPNFNAPESDKLRGLPVSSDYSIERVNVAIDVAVKTLHNILKVQKVLGLEIS